MKNPLLQQGAKAVITNNSLLFPPALSLFDELLRLGSLESDPVFLRVRLVTDHKGPMLEV